MHMRCDNISTMWQLLIDCHINSKQQHAHEQLPQHGSRPYTTARH
jgi:hypothetical protein